VGENSAEGGLEASLTRREIDVARLVSRGHPNKVIAKTLGIGEGTVKIHLHNVYRKLGIPNRTGLLLSMRDNL
jgi:two-component system, NarL family, nitrate/nitrite response regulator NarL